MSTELPAPSGINLHGSFFAVPVKDLEYFLALKDAVWEEISRRDMLSMLRDAGESDLMEYAQVYRSAQRNTDDVAKTLLRHMRGES
jgi:hypothetical protein